MVTIKDIVPTMPQDRFVTISLPESTESIEKAIIPFFDEQGIDHERIYLKNFSNYRGESTDKIKKSDSHIGVITEEVTEDPQLLSRISAEFKTSQNSGGHAIAMVSESAYDDFFYPELDGVIVFKKDEIADQIDEYRNTKDTELSAFSIGHIFAGILAAAVPITTWVTLPVAVYLTQTAYADQVIDTNASCYNCNLDFFYGGNHSEITCPSCGVEMEVKRETIEVGLVDDVPEQVDTPAKPRNLYNSVDFERMVSHVENEHDIWFILSAKHGLLDPDGNRIIPYDTSFEDEQKKQAWVERVHTQLDDNDLFNKNVEIVIHSREGVPDELVSLLRESDASVDIPTKGMTEKEKNEWYNTGWL
jgi:hypothetical protein